MSRQREPQPARLPSASTMLVERRDSSALHRRRRKEDNIMGTQNDKQFEKTTTRVNDNGEERILEDGSIDALIFFAEQVRDRCDPAVESPQYEFMALLRDETLTPRQRDRAARVLLAIAKALTDRDRLVSAIRGEREFARLAKALGGHHTRATRSMK
jgi:hypothetical protein